MTLNLADRNPAISLRSNELLRVHQLNIHQRTDRLFACLMFVQWLVCIAAAFWISPRTWLGDWSTTHIHVWAAFLLGGAISSLPILFAITRPGEVLTRHLLAAAQMLMSALLIHLTGGRIETHFHVFGSLALLAAYRDWRVLLTATVVIALDHGLRGALWPESVYGILTAAPWRTLEHAAWVVFEDIFLIITVRQSVKEMRNIAEQRAMLEMTNSETEEQVQIRTAQLQRAEERLRLIIDSVPNGVVMIDEAGIIKLANPKIEEMFGYSRGELLGREIEILVPKDVRPHHPELRNKFIESPEVRPMGSGRDLFGTRKNGTEFPVELGLNPLRTDEGIFVLAAVVDITERKKAESALQEYAAQLETANHDLTLTQAKLERKNQELDEFTYVASHDLQEPVRKLVSFSKLLEQDVGEALNEQASQDLKFIVDAAGRMRQLVQDLLALSRAGRSAMKSEQVRLDDCRKDAFYALQMRIDETEARIECDELPAVVGDATMLTQLYQNLIGNALKFIADEPPVVSLTAEEEDGQWILGVKDNGIGMKPEHAERIFKPFQRLHRRDQYEGTGIGLSICKKTVERHGGRLWVESNLGEGAHFKFTLPKMPETDPCPHTTETQDRELLSC
jgi:PAS domain S-box-containing protein